MATPYPWAKARSYKARIRLLSPLRKLITPLLLLVGLISPPASLITVAMHRWFRRYNLSTHTGPAIMAAVGVLGALFQQTIGGGLSGMSAVAKAQEAYLDKFVTAWWSLFPYALVLAAPLALLLNVYRDYSMRRYLSSRKPTPLAKRKARRIGDSIAQGDTIGDVLTPGYITSGDPLPWRGDRHGTLYTFDFDELGHGLIIGANGRGKTVLALSLLDQWCGLGYMGGMLDFKGNYQNRDKLAYIADTHGADFLQFTLHGDGDYFDPLDGPGDPDMKRSILTRCFEFDTTDEAFYRGQADRWLTIQFSALDAIGREDGEGTFDFLAATSSVNKLTERLESIHLTQPAIYRGLKEQISGVNNSDLEGLRVNLGKIAHSAVGRTLRRPTHTEQARGARYIDLPKIADSNTIAWWGLSAGADQMTAKTVGGLVCYALTAFAAERGRTDPSEWSDMLIVGDEFGLLEEQTTVVDDLVRTAREVRIWVWLMTQTLASFPDRTRREVTTNAYHRAVFTCQDKETVDALSALVGPAPYLERIQDINSDETITGDTRVDQSGAARDKLVEGQRLPTGLLQSVPSYHAYIWRSDPDTSHLRRKRPHRPTRRDDIPFDIPLVRIIPTSSALVSPPEYQRSTPAEGTAPVAHTVPDGEPVRAEQRRILTDYRTQLGDELYGSFLTGTGADAEPGTRHAATTTIDTLTGELARYCHTQLGDDGFAIEYNRIARYRRLAVWSGKDGDYTALGADNTLSLLDQVRAQQVHSGAQPAPPVVDRADAWDTPPAPQPEEEQEGDIAATAAPETEVDAPSPTDEHTEVSVRETESAAADTTETEAEHGDHDVHTASGDRDVQAQKVAPIPEGAPEWWAEAAKLLADGQSVRTVSATLEVHASNVYRWRKRAAELPAEPVAPTENDVPAAQEHDAWSDTQPAPPAPTAAPKLTATQQTWQAINADPAKYGLPTGVRYGRGDGFNNPTRSAWDKAFREVNGVGNSTTTHWATVAELASDYTREEFKTIYDTVVATPNNRAPFTPGTPIYSAAQRLDIDECAALIDALRNPAKL